MKQKVNLNDFRNAFRQAGRLKNFSYEALEVLFNYLEELEHDSKFEYELNIVKLCCTYTEYASFEEFQNDYVDYDSFDDLERDQFVLKVDDSRFMVQNF